MYKIVSRNQITESVVLTVAEDADLLAVVKSYAEQNGISGATIQSGIGALKQASYRNAKLFPEELPFHKEELLVETKEAPLELLNLTGWIARSPEGNPIVHCHISCSYAAQSGVKTVGGHLMPGTLAWLVVSINIATLKHPLNTQYNDNTKLWELV